MRFLPVVERELRMAARRRSTYGLRLLVALAAFTLTFWICTLPARGQPPAELGKSLFAVLAIPLLLGGVTPGEYGRVALAVVNAILFSLTAGMFVSALSREQSKAILG